MLTCSKGHDLRETGVQKRRPSGRLNGVRCRTCDAEQTRDRRWRQAFEAALAEFDHG